MEAERCRCGNRVSIYSDLGMCMTCTLADKDRRRAQEGPTVRVTKPSRLIAGPELYGNRRRREMYGERLAWGFAAMRGMDGGE